MSGTNVPADPTGGMTGGGLPTMRGGNVGSWLQNLYPTLGASSLGAGGQFGPNSGMNWLTQLLAPQLFNQAASGTGTHPLAAPAAPAAAPAAPYNPLGTGGPVTGPSLLQPPGGTYSSLLMPYIMAQANTPGAWNTLSAQQQQAMNNWAQGGGTGLPPVAPQMGMPFYGPLTGRGDSGGH